MSIIMNFSQSVGVSDLLFLHMDLEIDLVSPCPKHLSVFNIMQETDCLKFHAEVGGGAIPYSLVKTVFIMASLSPFHNKDDCHSL